MKRFTVYPIGMPQIQDVWLDTGFSLYSAEQGLPERPDVILSGPAITNDKLIENIQNYLPKVIIGVGHDSLELTEPLKEIYQLHVWRAEDINYLIATRIEAQLEIPQWHLYGEKAEEWHKGASDSVYRHLLYEVFRETQEWCGHTFSVVTGL